MSSQQGSVLTPRQFSVLAVVGRNPGMSQAQVCAALDIKRANLVAVIDYLESHLLILRQPSERDRRSNRLHLTPAGGEALQKAAAEQTAHEARITVLLGAAGREKLLRQLARLCDLASRNTRA